MKAYQSFNYNYKRAQSELQIFGILPKTFIEPFFMILVASLILSDKSSASSIIITLYGFMRLLPLGQVAYYNFNTFKGAKPTFLEFLGLIETAKVLSANVLEKSDFKSINLKRVSVTYGEIKILDRLSLEIRRGDRIAVLGRSGSGKTTLVDLLIGLIKSSSGELFIDNSLTSDIQFSYRMMSVTAHVKQDVFLVTGSILDNVAFNIPFDEIDFVKFNEVIRMSGLTEFIEKLPSKELTKLGENGAMISGGQRQRIGIARALYSGRKFIVFDEATSALDEETETGIFESLCQLDSTYTILFVTHKKELTKFSTKVIEL
jgi:ATP-binding cassette subfamily B protein